MAAPVASGAALMPIDQNQGIKARSGESQVDADGMARFPATMLIAVSNYPTTGVTTTFTESADVFTIGAGLVDIWAAYNDTTIPSGTAASPAVTYSSTTGTLTIYRVIGCQARVVADILLRDVELEQRLLAVPAVRPRKYLASELHRRRRLRFHVKFRYS